MMKSGKAFFVVLLFMIPLMFSSCKTNEGYKNQQHYERKMDKESKKAEREIEKLRKQHIKIQSKQTKEMMKQTRKKAKEINRFRRKK